MPPTPDPSVIARAQAGLVSTYSRVDIYEADAITPWMLNAPVLDGSVSIDSTREERRTASVTLSNTDRKFTSRPAGFWYDKVFRIYRGFGYNKNLAINSDFAVDTNVDGLADNWAVFNPSFPAEPVTTSFGNGLFGTSSQHLAWSVANTSAKGVQQTMVGAGGLPWEPFTNYVISFYARGNVSAVGSVGLSWNVAPVDVQVIGPNLDPDLWQRYVHLVRWPTGQVEPNGGFALGYFSNGTGYIEFDGVQIEKGTTVTPFQAKEETYETQLGEFFVDTIDSPHFPRTTTVNMRDGTKKLLEAKFAQSAQFASGSSIESIVQAIAFAGGIPIVKMNLPATGVNTDRSFLYDRTTERWKAITEICNAYNYDVFFDYQGILRMTPFADPSNVGASPSIFTFEAGGRNVKNANLDDVVKASKKAYLWDNGSGALSAYATSGLLADFGYDVTYQSGGALALTPQQMFDAEYDFIVLDGQFASVPGTHLDVAYQAYQLGINVFTSGNDTTFSAGCPIWTGAVNIGGGPARLRPTVPVVNVGTGSMLGRNWTPFNDDDGRIYLTGVRGSAFAFATATTVDDGVPGRPMGIVEASGGTTLNGMTARFVHLQNYWPGPVPDDLIRRIFTWLDQTKIPQWWVYGFEVPGGSGLATFTGDSRDTHSNGIALRIHVDAKDAQGTNLASKAIPVVPGEIYEISHWSKAIDYLSTTVTAGHYLRALFGTTENFARFDAGVSTQDIVAGSAFTQDWSKDTGQITVPNGVSWMRVAGYAWTESLQDYTAWFDDFEVKRVFPVEDTKGNIVTYSKKTDSARIYNKVIVTGESQDTAPVMATASNTTATSPTRIAKLGEKDYFYTSAFITTVPQAQAVADKFLKIHALESYEVGLESIVLPWLEPNSIVTFNDPEGATSDPVRYLLSDITVPLRPGSMSANLKRVTIVG